MTISELRKRSNDFVSNLDSHIRRVVNYANDDLVELNREQLRDSKLATGKTISRGYAPSYAKYKKTFWPESWAGGKVNLRLTGNLYDSLAVQVKGSELQITTDVSYARQLAEKFGDFAGIAPENYPKAQAIVVPLLRDEFKKRVLA